MGASRRGGSAFAIAHERVEAFNRHDLEAILSHYAESVALTSLLATRVLGDPAGTVRGKPALRAYFAKAWRPLRA